MCCSVQIPRMGFNMTVLKCHTIKTKTKKSHTKIHTNGNPETGTRKKESGREMPPEMMETPPFPEIFDPLLSPEPSKPSPGGHLSTQPPSPSSAASPLLSPVTPINRAVVWGSNGAVAQPRGVRWRSEESRERAGDPQGIPSPNKF